MPYAILRFQKRKAGSVAACERHNERKKEAYKSNPDIDIQRSNLNYHLVAPPKYTYKKEINRMVREAGCKVRRDSVMMVETLITASPEFMNSLPPAEQKAYFMMALDFLAERVGRQNILSAVVHMDEKTPHMHLSFCPITSEGKLSAKAFLGNQKSLSEWQTAYHERMSARWNELERGQSSMITGRKHIPTWLFKLGGRLDKQYDEIVKALSDINAFNAGKKRDKALELLSAWLPESTNRAGSRLCRAYAGREVCGGIKGTGSQQKDIGIAAYQQPDGTLIKENPARNIGGNTEIGQE